jgi:UDP-2,4-diacetamido-2,4,6-trideoxy-beta-L-altropyranose hydrolase
VERKGDAEISQMSDAAPGTLVVRADADVTRGIGHVMRCLAIAQEWRAIGGDVVFALHDAAVVEERLRSEGMGIHVIRATPGSAEDASQLTEVARARSAAWVVVDGYCFDETYQLGLGQSNWKLLFLDDFGHAGRYYADLILNQSPQGASISYPHLPKYAKLLLGPEYALLRREFKASRGSGIQVPSVAHRLLVTMGGTDEGNVTERVMEALPLLQMPRLEAIVVLGLGNPHKSSIRRTAANLGVAVKLLESPPNMPEVMMDADLAISAGGGTCYELALLRVPMFLITTAQNQEPTCRALAEKDAAIDGGWFHALESERLAVALRGIMIDAIRRKSLIESASKLVDGEGASRVVKRMLTVGA